MPHGEFGHRDHVAVGKVLESGISDVQLQGAIELVGQATLSELDLAVDAAVGGVGVELDHASILRVGRCPLPKSLGPSTIVVRAEQRTRWKDSLAAHGVGRLSSARPDDGVEIGAESQQE